MPVAQFLIKTKMKKAVRLYVSGNVQSTFYNAFVKENAEKLNVGTEIYI